MSSQKLRNYENKHGGERERERECTDKPVHQEF